MLRFLPALCVLLLLVSGCGDEGASTARSSTDTSAQATPAFKKEGTLAFVRDADTLSTIDVEIAETDRERSRGLMERVALPESSGMLFLFDENQPRSFWMKNTPMALDILFANADSQIVRVAKNTTPYSTERVESEVPAQFVVEVPAGYTSRRGIVEGDRIRFERTRGTAASSTRRAADAQSDSAVQSDSSGPSQAVEAGLQGSR